MNGKRVGRACGAVGAVLLLAVFAGCSSNMEKSDSAKNEERNTSSGMSETPAPEATQHAMAMNQGSTATVHGLHWDIAQGMVAEQPASSMRIAQYRLPSGKEGVKDGELAVFFFGSGQGGDTQSNLQRWAGQFKQNDGSDPMQKAKIDKVTSSGGLAITTISLTGHYQSAMMGGGPSYDEPGWKLFGAVAEGQGGPWFFKAVGPESVIDDWQPRLREMMQGLKAAS